MMQYNPTKLNLNYPGIIYTNQYQPQFGTDNIYQSHQSPPPPPYSSYSQQVISGPGYAVPSVQYYGQTLLYPQQAVVIASPYRSFWMNPITTTITPSLRVFCIISGIIYTIWSLAIIGLEVTVIIESYWTFYRSIWASGFTLGGGICMLIIACQTFYPMRNLIKLFTLILFFDLFGLILSAINYGTSEKCSSTFASEYSCDTELVNTLKMTNLIVIIAATIHTLINILVFSKEHRKTLLKSTVPNH